MSDRTYYGTDIPSEVLPDFVLDESDGCDPRIVYDGLTPQQAWDAWPCDACRTRRAEHADQPDGRKPFPELDIVAHPFVAKRDLPEEEPRTA